MPKMAIDTEGAVRRLALEHPDWLPVLEAAAAVAARVEESGGEFAGAWVLGELRSRGGARWVPNLRPLVTYCLLEKSGDSTRGGRRAYYRMPDRPGVERALEAWRDRPPARPKTPRFIGSGMSTVQPADAGRRAGDQVFEPRSWR